MALADGRHPTLAEVLDMSQSAAARRRRSTPLFASRRASRRRARDLCRGGPSRQSTSGTRRHPRGRGSRVSSTTRRCRPDREPRLDGGRARRPRWASSTATDFHVASLRAAGDETRDRVATRDAKSDAWTTTRSRGKLERCVVRCRPAGQIDVRRLLGTVAAEVVGMVRRPAAAIAIASRPSSRSTGGRARRHHRSDATGDNRLPLRLAARSQRRARTRVADSDAKRHMAERNDREQWG